MLCIKGNLCLKILCCILEIEFISKTQCSILTDEFKSQKTWEFTFIPIIVLAGTIQYGGMMIYNFMIFSFLNFASLTAPHKKGKGRKD